MGLCERMSAFESVLCYVLTPLKRKDFSGGAGSREKVWSVCPGHRGRTTKEAEQTTQKSQAQVSHSSWVSPVMCFVLLRVCAYLWAWTACLCIQACMSVCGHAFYVCALACMCVSACMRACMVCLCLCAHACMSACLWVHAFLQSLCACVCSLKKKVTIISTLFSIL